MRAVIEMPCGGDTLFATLDHADGATGLLIVSRGGEPRCGPHRGMASLAARLAADGVPVMRYDRRGVGDASGADPGYADAGPDLIAAAAAFRREAPALEWIVGLGIGDAAATLTLFGREAGIDTLILGNPLVVEDDAVRAPRARWPWWRRWIARATGRRAVPPPALAHRVAAALEQFADTSIVLAAHDPTAIAFADRWQGTVFAAARDHARITRIAGASHDFARPAQAAAFEAAIRAALGLSRGDLALTRPLP